jgi:hypothetical protein
LTPGTLPFCRKPDDTFRETLASVLPASRTTDGVELKEETQANGDRKGQYSYIDPTGKKRTVQYTAGKYGFQVSGDHLPRAPLPVQAPALQYNSAAQYNSIPQGGNSYNNNKNGVKDGQ